MAADLDLSSDDALAHFPEPLMVLDTGGAIVGANAAARAIGGAPSSPGDGSTAIERVLAKARLVNGGGSPPWVAVPGRNGFDALVAATELPADEPIYELRSSARIDAGGRPAGWVVRLMEITPLIVALRGRKAAEGQRDRLLKLMSHDLRSPLAVILSTLGRPDAGELPDDPRRVIETAARRTLHMIDSNVRSVRAESADYAFVPLDLSHIVEEVIDDSWSSSKAAGVKLVLEPASEEPFILADRGFLTLALTALFRQLLKTSSPGRVLECGFRTDVLRGKPAVTVSIRDREDKSPNRGRPTTPEDSAARSKSEVDPAEMDDGFIFLNTVVARHGGATTYENETGMARIVSITIPLADPILHS